MLVSAWPIRRRVAAQRHRARRQDRVSKAISGCAVRCRNTACSTDRWQVLGLQHRRRHAGEGRELVDHPADILDLADDGVGADREGLRVLLDLLQVFAAQPFGGELDRGQRVLDLVRDAAGDVGPGRLALRRQQLGDVVEGHDEAADLAARHARRRCAPAGCGVLPCSAICTWPCASRSGRRAACSSRRPSRARHRRGARRSTGRDRRRAAPRPSGWAGRCGRRGRAR